MTIFCPSKTDTSAMEALISFKSQHKIWAKNWKTIKQGVAVRIGRGICYQVTRKFNA
jgi:hypothetical protein